MEALRHSQERSYSLRARKESHAKCLQNCNKHDESKSKNQGEQNLDYVILFPLALDTAGDDCKHLVIQIGQTCFNMPGMESYLAATPREVAHHDNEAECGKDKHAHVA